MNVTSASPGEGFAFYCWYRLNYDAYARWHKGRKSIWLLWWRAGTGRYR